MTSSCSKRVSTSDNCTNYNYTSNDCPPQDDLFFQPVSYYPYPQIDDYLMDIQQKKPKGQYNFSSYNGVNFNNSQAPGQTNIPQQQVQRILPSTMHQHKMGNIKHKKILKSVNRKNKLKNVNIPKFISRVFFHYLDQYKSEFDGFQPSYQVAQQRANYLRNWASQSKNNYLSLDYLREFFEDKKKEGMNSTLNRKVMSFILRDHLNNQVKDNYQLIHKESYLTTLKIYQLRCMSGELTSRVQSK